MCKHEKWVLELDRDTTRSRPECEVVVVARKDHGLLKKGSIVSIPTQKLRAMRLARESELEQQRIDLDKEMEQKTDDRELVKMQLVHLNTLLQKEHLSLEE
uniref:Uncharacterized protein n=1 Tax=Lactuca sativa TaxID=4236 RepID=A0A9R1WDZ0_LACSA|nr:hypothetical protein LSAT_V11C200072950 [Lactuca sativa]